MVKMDWRVGRWLKKFPQDSYSTASSLGIKTQVFSHLPSIGTKGMTADLQRMILGIRKVK